MILKNKLFKSIFITFVIALVTLLISITISITPFYKRGQNSIFYYLLHIKSRIKNKKIKEKTEDVAIIAIDDLSLAQFSENVGQNWPWPRNWWGLMADYLVKEGGAKAVVFDIVFSGPDFDRLDISGFDSDYGFYSAIMRNKNIVLACNIDNNVDQFFTPENFTEATYNNFLSFLDEEDKERINWLYYYDEELGFYRLNDYAQPKHRRYVLNLLKEKNKSDFMFSPIDIKNADDFESISRYKYLYIPYDLYTINNRLFGFVDNEAKEADGIVQTYKPFVKVKNNYIPSISLATYLLENEEIPEDLELKNGEFTLNWYGEGYVGSNENKEDNPGITFDYYSAWWIMLNARQNYMGRETRIEKGAFKDKVVFVGGTSRGLMDQKSTPFSEKGKVFPGVEIHATAYLNMINKDWINHFPFYAEIIVYFLIVLLFSYLGIRASSLGKYIVYFISGFCVVLLGQFFIFINFLILSQAFLFIFMNLLSFLLTIAISYITVGHNRNKIRQAFGTYVSPDLLKRVTDSENPLSTTGENINATAMFIDIAGFTTFSERNTPERVVEILNLYLKRFSESIIAKQGYINKYLGDGLMALFGTPTTLENHADLAVQSAIECMKINDELHPEYGLNIRIGVNSGRMIVGNVGGGKKLEYTSIGDSVNLASRLEGVNKFIKAKICVGENTYNDLKDSLSLQYLGKFSVKGKDIPIGVYFYSFSDELIKNKFNEMVQAYEGAEKVKFEELIRFFSQPEHTFGPADFYIQYYEEFEELFGKPIKLTEK